MPYIWQRSRWHNNLHPVCYYCEHVVRQIPQGGRAYQDYARHLRDRHPRSVLWRESQRRNGALPISEWRRRYIQEQENDDYWNILAQVMVDEAEELRRNPDLIDDFNLGG